MESQNFQGQQTRTDISFGQVFKELVDSTKDVIRSEANLFKTEFNAFLPNFKKHATQAAIFGALLVLSVLPFIAFLVIGLGNLLDGRYWLSSLIVSVVFAVVGGIFASRALKAIKNEDFKFDRTKQSLNEAIHATKQKVDVIKTAAKGVHYEPNTIVQS